MIFLPAGTGEVTAHDALDGEWLRLSHNHGASGELIAKWFQFSGELIEVCRDEMIIDLVESLEPEGGKLIKHRAFLRDWVGQNHIEGREPVGHDEEQRVAKIKDFADLSAAEFFDSGKIDNRLWSGRHKCDIISAWLESSSNRGRGFCMGTIGFSAAKS